MEAMHDMVDVEDRPPAVRFWHRAMAGAGDMERRLASRSVRLPDELLLDRADERPAVACAAGMGCPVLDGEDGRDGAFRPCSKGQGKEFPSMKYVTLEIFKNASAWAMVSLGLLGFQPAGNMRQAESHDPVTGKPTIFVRGRFEGDPTVLHAVPSVVGVYDRSGIGILIERAQK